MGPITPGALAFDGQGILWIADRAGCRLLGAERTGRVVKDFPLPAGDSPVALAARDDGAALFVAGPASVLRLDARQGAALALPGSPAASGLAVDEHAGLLYLASIEEQAVFRRSLQGGEWRRLAGVAGPPVALALSPDRRRLYVAIAGAAAAVLAVELREDPGRTSLIAALAGARPAAIAHTPAGLAVIDERGALLGVNPRHGTVVKLYPPAAASPLAAPAGVAFDREGRSFVVSEAGASRLLRLARDLAGAAAIPLEPA